MKTLYLDCSMGAAGDMLMGALLELHPQREAFLDTLNQIGLPGIQVTAEPSKKCGITGTHISVLYHGTEEESLDILENSPHQIAFPSHIHEHIHTHTHSSLESVSALIDQLSISTEAKGMVKDIYEILAEAEGAVHGVAAEHIHFHEVGTADALADITGCVLLLQELEIQKVWASSVTTGYGQVRCAHGILPVPAPATAQILCGIPCRAGRIQGELCTPTGAALLKYFVSEYGPMPEMVMEKIGYGMGKKDFEAANCLRAILGESR